MRVFQVALLPSYGNVTSPQKNLTASIPWSKPNAGSVAGLSAYCYYHVREVANAHPDTPLGVVVSAWGGTAIQPWMTPEAVANCSHIAPAPEVHMRVQDFWARIHFTSGQYEVQLVQSVPKMPGTLWNSMLAPLLPLKPTAWLWYQVRETHPPLPPPSYRHRHRHCCYKSLPQ